MASNVDRDRYADLGPRLDARDEEDALAQVRAAWPGAWREGSTGSERTYYVGDRRDADLVAHSWSPRGLLERFYLRIRSADAPTRRWSDG